MSNPAFRFIRDYKLIKRKEIESEEEDETEEEIED